MKNLHSSNDRLAWSSTREQGMGSGRTVHNDRQPDFSKRQPLVRDYYISKEYKDSLRVEK